MKNHEVKMSKFYRFDFNKGVPAGNSQMKWRKGVKTISAYCLQHAVEKFAMPVLREFGTEAKLNVFKAWVSPDKKTWKEVNLQNLTLAAFLVGCYERVKSEK